MIKSLYVRLVFIFFGSIFISVAISFIVTHRLYNDGLRPVVQDSLIASGKTIIKSYQEAYPHNLDALMNGITALPIYSIRMFDHDGKPMHETDKHPVTNLLVSDSVLQQVLHGGVYRGNWGEGSERLVVGLPFEIDGEPYALFLTPDLSKFAGTFSKYFRLQLLIVMLFGCILIVIASRYIVRPVQYLTSATRKMAKGDFTIRLHTKRKDEIGQLTNSFNQMAHELGMLEKVRRQFVSDVSHEIQSPLTSIKGFTQALKHKKMDEASRMRLLDIIEEETNRLSRLSADLLQLSALDHEHLQLNKRTYLLDEQIRNVVIASEPQWSSKSLEIDLDLAALQIRADEDKLSQLWTNLLGNAIKFTNEHGVIRIRARRDKSGLAITIADSGQGIPEEELAHIFKPFYKVDASRDHTVQGNGIGLSIVKRIVDLHEGDIQVTSSVGAGTTVKVILPDDLP